MFGGNTVLLILCACVFVFSFGLLLEIAVAVALDDIFLFSGCSGPSERCTVWRAARSTPNGARECKPCKWNQSRKQRHVSRKHQPTDRETPTCRRLGKFKPAASICQGALHPANIHSPGAPNGYAIRAPAYGIGRDKKTVPPRPEPLQTAYDNDLFSGVQKGRIGVVRNCCRKFVCVPRAWARRLSWGNCVFFGRILRFTSAYRPVGCCKPVPGLVRTVALA